MGNRSGKNNKNYKRCKNGEGSDKNLKSKWSELRKRIASLESAVVAFSGGVDSTLLLRICRDELGGKVVAVTSASPSYPKSELEEAGKIAKSLCVRHVIVKSSEMKDANYRKNPADRCYFCKTNLYSHLRKVARRARMKNVLNGTNFDDVSDYRPGIRASDELGMLSPLKDAGFTKNDIIALSRKLGLPNWDKPSSPCLASRIPYGTPVTLKALRMIDDSEAFLKRMGFRQLRVRYYGKKARLEFERHEIPLARRKSREIGKALKKIGFERVEIDPEGFRSGNLNRVVLEK